MIDKLTQSEQEEVTLFGCTRAKMREATEQSSIFRYSGPSMMVIALIHEAQDHINDQYGEVDWMRREDARQALNRAKWVLGTYCMNNKEEVA
jgi:hypothetical protein